MQIVTPALVLREVQVGEADRILLLLTPEQGLISASAKGSLRLKSRLFSGCGLFCYSEFTLYEGRTMYRVDEAQVKNTFFGLRESVEGMALAMYRCARPEKRRAAGGLLLFGVGRLFFCPRTFRTDGPGAECRPKN